MNDHGLDNTRSEFDASQGDAARDAITNSRDPIELLADEFVERCRGGEELSIEERTLVLFTSDNGPHSEGGHKHEFFDANGPLRGFKRDLYEGGIRVPLIARWPGVVKPGTVSNHASAFWDFLPTACELAGVAPTDDTDGISFVPALLGREQPAHDYLYWKYGPKSAVRMGKWKAVRLKDDWPVELYDLDCRRRPSSHGRLCAKVKKPSGGESANRAPGPSIIAFASIQPATQLDG